MKNELEKLYAKEMERSDFLKYIGALFLTVIGISGLMRAVLHNNHSLLGKSESSTQGYGSSGYGGFLDQSH
jgi:hypothetical protein